MDANWWPRLHDDSGPPTWGDRVPRSPTNEPRSQFNRAMIAGRSNRDCLELFRETLQPSDLIVASRCIQRCPRVIPSMCWSHGASRPSDEARDHLRWRSRGTFCISTIACWWTSNASKASTCRPVSLRSYLRTLYFTHVLVMEIAWTRVHAIDAPRSHPTTPMLPRVLQR